MARVGRRKTGQRDNGRARQSRRKKSSHRGRITGGRGMSPRPLIHPRRGASLSAESLLRLSNHVAEDQATVLDETGQGSERIRLETEGAPAGYVFVPKGNPYVTKHCRLKIIEQGRTLYTVLNARQNNTLGLYVPAAIACAVYAQEEATRAERAEAVEKKDTRDARKYRDLLLKAYPSIPAEDVSRILSHAFLKGSGRVGRSSTVRGGEEVKLRLAVEAHIRHVHTEYESLLCSGVPRNKAREQVGSAVKRIRDEWAGLQIPDSDIAKQPREPEVIVIDSDSSDLEILSN